MTLNRKYISHTNLSSSCFWDIYKLYPNQKSLHIIRFSVALATLVELLISELDALMVNFTCNCDGSQKRYETHNISSWLFHWETSLLIIHQNNVVFYWKNKVGERLEGHTWSKHTKLEYTVHIACQIIYKSIALSKLPRQCHCQKYKSDDLNKDYLIWSVLNQTFLYIIRYTYT